MTRIKQGTASERVLAGKVDEKIGAPSVALSRVEGRLTEVREIVQELSRLFSTGR